MKKKILLLLLGTATISSFAQNVWTGTSIPTATSGTVAIGTTNSATRLNILSANTFVSSGQPLLPSALKITNAFGSNNSSANIIEIYTGPLTVPNPTPPSLVFWVRGNNGDVGIQNSLNVGKTLRIGATAANGSYANYALSVDGSIIAKKCVIQVSSWADYVFDKDYQLPSLDYVEKYVIQNKHLPDVPSESEIKTNGADIETINKALLKKVEELTLYIIEQDKRIKSLEEKVDK